MEHRRKVLPLHITPVTAFAVAEYKRFHSASIWKVIHISIGDFVFSLSSLTSLGRQKDARHVYDLFWPSNYIIIHIQMQERENCQKVWWHRPTLWQTIDYDFFSSEQSYTFQLYFTAYITSMYVRSKNLHHIKITLLLSD